LWAAIYRKYFQKGATIVTINVLVCRPDGSQSMEQREVADDYLAVKEEPTDEQQQ
jgi:hypothetical protein